MSIDRDEPPAANHAPGAPAHQRPRDRSNTPATGAAPSRARAWKIADFRWQHDRFSSTDAHDRPSSTNDKTSSYEPSNATAIPIEKYAITRASNDRCRNSVRPARDHLIDKLRWEHPV